MLHSDEDDGDNRNEDITLQSFPTTNLNNTPTSEKSLKAHSSHQNNPHIQFTSIFETGGKVNEKPVKSFFSQFDMVISTIEGVFRKRINRVCTVCGVPLLEFETAKTIGHIFAPLLQESDEIHTIYSEIGITSCFSSIDPIIILLILCFDYHTCMTSSYLHQLNTNEKKQDKFLTGVIQSISSCYEEDRHINLPSNEQPSTELPSLQVL